MGDKAKFNIKIVTPQGTEERCIEEDSFIVGRGAECTLSLLHDKISRKHLQCSLKNGEIWIEDLGSSNGTFINDIILAPHIAIKIEGTEKIQIGNSEIFIFIQTAAPKPRMEAILPEEVPGKVLVQKEKPVPPAEKIEIHGVVSPKLILKHARSQASSIILEAESEAEKRVQEIYQRANETRKKAEDFYRQRLQVAHDDAHKVIEDAGEEGRELISEARTRAQTIRDEVDRYASDLRKGAEKECESILVTAEKTMRSKEQLLLEKATKETTAERAKILAETKEKIEAELKVHHNDITDLQKQIEELSIKAEGFKTSNSLASEESQKAQREIKELNVQIASLQKNCDYLKVENSTLKSEFDVFEKKKITLISEQMHLISEIEEKQKEKAATELETTGLKKSITILSEKLVTLHTSLKSGESEQNEKMKELQALQAKILETKTAHSQAQKETDSLKALKDRYLAEQTKIAATSERSKKEVEKLVDQINSLNEKLTILTKKYEAENSVFKDKLEASKSRYEKIEEEYADTLRLQTSAKFTKMEAELLQQLDDKKELLSREIVLHAESLLQGNISNEIWRQKAKELEKQTRLLLSGQVTTMNGKTIEPAGEKSFVLQKKREQYYRVMIGAALGAVLVLMVQTTLKQMNSERSPLQERAELASKEKQQDLQLRRFEPKQVATLKENYTDAVIYTKGFTSVYLDPDYQKRWFSAATSYLLRTWRTDEAVSIQVLSMAAALVKGLEDRRQNIHPDFVKEGILKMRDLEKESTDRLIATLGSEVRFESFKKFEKEFFEKELKGR